MNRLLLLFSTLVLSLLGGCSTTQFIVIDAATQQPIEGVQVDGYRFRPLQQMPADFAWNEIAVASTNDLGRSSSASVLSLSPAENEFRFVFTRVGYQPAEALVYRDRTLIASPADDAGWQPTVNDPHHLLRNVPTRNYVTIPSGEKLLIQLYPVGSPPTTAPASKP